MTQHQNPGVLGHIAASQQRQPAGDLARRRDTATGRHERLACRTHGTISPPSPRIPHNGGGDLAHRQKPQLTALRRVLDRYRLGGVVNEYYRAA